MRFLLAVFPTDPGQRARVRPDWLRGICLEAGADDVGSVEIGRAALDHQRDDILYSCPRTGSLVSFLLRMNREPIRSPARSVSPDRARPAII